MRRLGFFRILFFFVLPAHLAFLAGALIFRGCGEPDFPETEVTSIELVSAPAAETAQEPPVEPEPLPPEPPEPEPEPPRLVTRKIEEPQPIPESNLAQRLQRRLDEVRAPRVPRAAPAPRGRAAAGETSSDWYNTYIQQRMYSLWRQPGRSVVKQSRATAVVGFRVYRDGHIENIRLIRSSGNRAMDDSVLEAVRMADPLIPPGEIDGRYVEKELLFELKE